MRARYPDRNGQRTGSEGVASEDGGDAAELGEPVLLGLGDPVRGPDRRRREAEPDRPTEILLWAFGASLFGHVVSFFGTSYFDQTIVLWHFTLALLASLALLTSQPVEVAELEVLADSELIDKVPVAKPFPTT